MVAEAAAAARARWSRRKKARPSEILEAALKVFAEKGYAGARMDDIASRAGVTKGTIYLYFDSKETVFKTLVRESIGATLSSVTASADAFPGSARDLLRLALGSMAELLTASDRVVLPKIIIAESGNFPELARFYRKEIIDKGLALMSGVIARGVASGEFRDLPVEHIVRLCIAPVLLGAMWRTTFEQFDPHPYDYKGLIDTHLEVLFRGLERDTP
ncbi:MAG TPA: TetR/AcrR family transcriptional regulator [Rhizomicrobium sp.]|jgi:AcrR family transcriptional regulator|nr:TetR/AcrR family transcriptional regulator [Rhizomicrobium sp.]